MIGIEKSAEFELSGGALCLDFVNTLGDRPRSNEEHLEGYDELLRFSRQAESLPGENLDALDRLLTDCPGCADAVFNRAIELREALYRIFSRIARGEVPEVGDSERLNTVLSKALRQLEVREKDGAFEWGWGGPAQALDRPLWPIARSAAELLTSEEVNVIRECAAETCSWLFVDRSRNRRRRWCDMSTCGNRAKARRHYHRQKQSRTN